MAEVQIPPGVVRGATPASRPGRWYDANLIRWRDGNLEPVGGQDRLTSAPLGSRIRRILTWRDNTDIYRIALGCDTSLTILEADVVFDATPPGFVGVDAMAGLPAGFGVGAYGEEDYGDARAVGSATYLRATTWSLDTWGEQLLAVASSDGRLLRYDPQSPSSPAAVIAQAPTGNRAMVVTPERHVMLIGAGGEPRRVAWCSREDYTDWDFASTTNTAGFLDLDSDGLLVAATEVRDGVLVHSDSDVWLLRYLGSPFVFGRERVGTQTSLMSPHAIATFGGRAVWLGKNGFWLYDGGACNPLPCDVAGFVFGDIDPVYGPLRAHASANGMFGEIWFFWPSRGATECDRYTIWHHDDGWWSIGRLEFTAMLAAGVHRLPLAATASNHLVACESGYTNGGAPRVGTVWAESAPVGEAGKQIAVLRAQMDSGAGWDATQVKVITRDTREGSDVEHGPFVPNSDGRIPMRVGGQDVRVRVEATKDAAWSIGRMGFDVVPVGNR